MRSTIIFAAAIMGVIALASATRASAFPTYYSDQDAFHALGTIDQVTDFSEFAAGTYQFIDDPYVDGDLTITTGGQNVITTVGTAPFFPVHNALISNNGGYIEVEFDPTAQYDLFSFKAGTFKGPFGATIYMHLNNGQEPSSNVYALPIQEGLKFQGWQADPGTWFTGFTLVRDSQSTGLALAEVELGHTGSAAPEPTAWALMILGFGGVGASLRTRRRLALLDTLAS